MRSLPTLLATVALPLGILFAVPAAPTAAQPKCTQTGPGTTLCETNGSAALTTSPPEMNLYPWYGLPLYGFGIGIGW